MKKLNWVPDVIHINGWMSSFVPIYLKTYYKNDNYFADTKIVLSLYNEKDGKIQKNVEEKMKFDNIEGLSAFKKPSFQSFVAESINFVDAVVKGDEFLEGMLEKEFGKTKTPKLEYLELESIGTLYDK